MLLFVNLLGAPLAWAAPLLLHDFTQKSPNNLGGAVSDDVPLPDSLYSIEEDLAGAATGTIPGLPAEEKVASSVGKLGRRTSGVGGATTG
ncbi:MAG: hypothetical protein GY721_11300, partial [Deltaproteobacteria bacterium]|nr:hypothetical protein [Deltaproteobacteria bacterium]